MSRPSSNTYRRLVEAGRKLMPAAGMSRLSVRQVCRRAGVNLGMFHYHFKSKEKFAKVVIDELYEDFFRSFSARAAGQGSTVERLRIVLRTIAMGIRENLTGATAIILDAANGYLPAVTFLVKAVPRHHGIMRALVREGMARGMIRKTPLAYTVTQLHFAVTFPILAFGLIRHALSGSHFRGLAERTAPIFVSTRSIDRRLDMLFKCIGIRKQGASYRRAAR